MHREPCCGHCGDAALFLRAAGHLGIPPAWPAEGEAWARGGANCWTTPTFDPELNLLYFNTGNPCPDFDGGVREGDNLYTNCVVAVDPAYLFPDEIAGQPLSRCRASGLTSMMPRPLAG